MSEDRKIAVIIPVYNEKNTIKELLARVYRSALVKEVIIVDDGSTDGTGEVLDKEHREGVKILKGGRNRGKGWAVRRGLEEVSAPIVVIQDADLEYDPSDYRGLIVPILKGSAKAVYGNRLGIGHFARHPLHFLGNKILTVLVNMVYGADIKDVSCGTRMFRKDALEGIECEANGFEYDVEITAKLLASGTDIVSLPVTYVQRADKEGKKLGWKDRRSLLGAVFKFRDPSGVKNRVTR